VAPCGATSFAADTEHHDVDEGSEEGPQAEPVEEVTRATQRLTADGERLILHDQSPAQPRSHCMMDHDAIKGFLIYINALPRAPS
jgi:hypothetical protein